MLDDHRRNHWHGNRQQARPSRLSFQPEILVVAGGADWVASTGTVLQRKNDLGSDKPPRQALTGPAHALDLDRNGTLSNRGGWGVRHCPTLPRPQRAQSVEKAEQRRMASRMRLHMHAYVRNARALASEQLQFEFSRLSMQWYCSR